MRIALVMLLSAAVGVLLAAPWIDWPLHEGYVGVILMVGAALLLRRYWQRRAETRGDEPGEPEREVTDAEQPCQQPGPAVGGISTKKEHPGRRRRAHPRQGAGEHAPVRKERHAKTHSVRL